MHRLQPRTVRLGYAPSGLAVLLALLILRPVATAQTNGPDMHLDVLATGPYSQARMLLEKTILRVDVLTVEMRFDRATQQALRRLAEGRSYSETVAALLAAPIVDADDAYVRLAFLRDVSLARWIEGVRESLVNARDTGAITADTFRRVSEGLPVWFTPVAQRGFRSGDRILYRAYPDRMRTVVQSAGGDVLLDHTTDGEWAPHSMLASYFAPGSDFREPLLRSLFDTAQKP